MVKNINLEKSSISEFIVNKENNSLIPPFSSIDGLGESVAIKIFEENKNRSFSSNEDFKKRTRVNKTLFDKWLFVKESKINKLLIVANIIILGFEDI